MRGAIKLRLSLGIVIQFLMLVSISSAQTQTRFVTGYFANHSVNTLPPEYVDYSALTHIIHFATDVDSTPPHLQILTSATDSARWEDAYTNRNIQKALLDSAHRHNVKVMLSIANVNTYGGNNATMTYVTNDSARCQLWVNATLAYARRKGYDGIDLNWEWPRSSDEPGYTRMMRMFRRGLDQWPTRGILTHALYPTAGFGTGATIRGAYNIPLLNQYVDQHNVELYGLFAGQTNLHLGHTFQYGKGTADGLQSTFDAITLTDSFPHPNDQQNCGPLGLARGGWDKKKIGVGLGFLYYHVTSNSPLLIGGSNTGTLQNWTRYNFADVWGTRTGQFGAYPEYWDDGAKMHYKKWRDASGVYHYLTYEDSLSLSIKAKWIRDNGFNVMIYELGTGYITSNTMNAWHVPNFQGVRDPLLKAVKLGFGLGQTNPPPPADTVRPVVSISSPTSGAQVQVGSIVGISASASDNNGVVRVDFKIDGNVVGSDATAPYSYNWHTIGLTPGSLHSISASAIDVEGNVGTSAAISITIDPVIPPPAPPQSPVLLTPADGAQNLSTNVSLTWRSAVAAETYAVQVSIDSAFSSTIFSLTGLADTSTGINDLENNTAYFWRVNATNGAGTGGWSEVRSFHTEPPPIPDTIPSPAVLRDDFNRPDGPLVGVRKWSAIANHPGNASMAVGSDALVASSSLGLNNSSGILWDTLLAGGTEASLVVRQKSANYSYASLMIYARMTGKDYLNSSGYRMRFMEQAGTDLLEISRLNGRYNNATILATTNLEIQQGDVIAFRVLSDNQTMCVLVNNTKVLQWTDSTYTPAQWYYAFRSYVFATPARFDDFRVSTTDDTIPPPTAPVATAPPDGAANQPPNPTLVWNSVSGAVGYHLQVSTDSTFGSFVLNDSSLAGSSIELSALAPATRYFWRVRALGASSSSNFSTASSFLTGSAPAAVLTINRKNLDFGRVGIGTTKKDSVVLGNGGSMPITINRILPLSSNYWTDINAATIAPGGSQKIYISFSPNERVAYDGIIISASDDLGLTDTVKVTGRGVNPPRNRRTPGSMTFHILPTGEEQTDSFVVRNDGELNLEISDIKSTNPVFTVTPNTAIVAPDDSMWVRVFVSQQSLQSEAGYIIFNDNSLQSTDSMMIELTPLSGVGPTSPAARAYSLEQNYPNPFNPTTEIRYELPAVSSVSLKIYNLLGELVRTLVQSIENEGWQTAVWDGRDENGRAIPSGTYIYRIDADPLSRNTERFFATRKMVLLK